MKMKAGVALFAACYTLSGCALLNKLSDQSRPMVGAEPLSVTPAEMIAAQSSSDKREFLGRVAYDSLDKCTRFLNRLVVTENTVNATGDIVSTVLSAIATFTTPIHTVHVLTAGSTIATGTKTAINSDIYAKASIANFQTALRQTYFADIEAYVQALSKQAEADIIVSGEVSKIQTIHYTCSLASAQNAISDAIAAKKPDQGAGGASSVVSSAPAPAPVAPVVAPAVAPPAAPLTPLKPAATKGADLKRRLGQ